MAHPGAHYETRHVRGDAMAAHRHPCAYAALVIDGSHLECSVDGPVQCQPGTLLLHPAFHAHANRFEACGARVLNLDLPGGIESTGLVALQVQDLRDARRIFVHADQQALLQLAACASAFQSDNPHCWKARMVEALGTGEEPVADIAARFGVSPAHASRALLRSHGMGPLGLRRELRWRHALSLLAGDATLADVAAQARFADQSHLHRVVRACSGMTPGQLRRQIKSVQDRERRTAA